MITNVITRETDNIEINMLQWTPGDVLLLILMKSRRSRSVIRMDRPRRWIGRSPSAIHRRTVLLDTPRCSAVCVTVRSGGRFEHGGGVIGILSNGWREGRGPSAGRGRRPERGALHGSRTWLQGILLRPSRQSAVRKEAAKWGERADFQAGVGPWRLRVCRAWRANWWGRASWSPLIGHRRQQAAGVVYPLPCWIRGGSQGARPVDLYGR